jgi:hypothetical protein
LGYREWGEKRSTGAGSPMSILREKEGLSMTEDVQLAALAVIELVARQIADPAQTQEHRDELEVILAGTDARWVALELATVLVGAAAVTGFNLGALIEAKRAQLLAT